MNSLKKLAKLAKYFNGAPDELPSIIPIFRAAGNNSEWKTTISTDYSWGGRSTALFHTSARLPNGGVGGVFEGHIRNDQRSDTGAQMAGKIEGRPQKFGFAMITFQRVDGDTLDATDYEALDLEVLTDGRLYTVSLKGSAPFAPELTYQGFIGSGHSDRAAGEFDRMELPFKNLVPLRNGSNVAKALTLDNARIDKLIFSVSAEPGPFRLVFNQLSVTRDTEDDHFYDKLRAGAKY